MSRYPKFLQSIMSHHILTEGHKLMTKDLLPTMQGSDLEVAVESRFCPCLHLRGTYC